MNTKKLFALASVTSALILGGCQANTTVPESSEVLMSIGNKSITKGQEYQDLKQVSGTTGVLALVNKQIGKEEVGETEEIKKQADEAIESFKSIDNYEDQLKTLGYNDLDEYKNNFVIPNLQAQELVKKYFTDAKEEIIQEFDPTLVSIIETDSEDNANKALEALKKGEDAGKVGGQYAKEGATYTGVQQIISTADSTLPESLRNAILDAGKDGVIDEVFTNDTSTDDKTYYVATVASTDYDANLDKIIAALSNNQTIAKNCQIFYLKKYDFEVHDQEIFNSFKASSPEYLVTRPDLAENATSETNAS